MFIESVASYVPYNLSGTAKLVQLKGDGYTTPSLKRRVELGSPR